MNSPEKDATEVSLDEVQNIANISPTNSLAIALGVCWSLGVTVDLSTSP